MKKKLFSVMLVAALATSLLAGCGKSKNTEANNTQVENVTEQASETKKVQKVTSDMANITGNLGTGVALDYSTVSTDTEEYKTIEEYLKDTNATFEMFDINLLDKDKKKVQPNGVVEVTVKLSDNMKNAAGDTYVVFHNQGKDFTKIACTEKDGYVTFKTNHFSIYTVVKYNSTEETTEQKMETVKETVISTEEIEKFEKEVEETKKNNNGKIDVVSNDDKVSDNKPSKDTPTQQPEQVQPNEPQKPAESDIVKPDQPNQPETPTKPTEAEKPAEPDPVQPDEPDQPETPTEPTEQEEEFDGYDRFGNKFVEKVYGGRYYKYFNADNPYTLDTYEWIDNDMCLRIIKDLGTGSASEIDERVENTSDSICEPIEDMFGEKHPEVMFTTLPTSLGCYNGHWIVLFEGITMDDFDKYCNEVFFYDKDGNPHM